MKRGRREFIKSICVLAGGTLLLGSKLNAFEKNDKVEITKEEKKCTSIYCKYNSNGICSNQNINNE